MNDLVIRARRAIVGDTESACSVVVTDGRIVAIEAYDAEVDAHAVALLAEDDVLLPGLVDTHVHINEPGRTEWEGFRTATMAAAAGGVTTLVDMPLNSLPPTVSVEALAVKRQAAQGQTWVDVGFWGGAVPDHLGDLDALHADGVFGFKCFLVDSGVSEFPPLDAAGLVVAMGTIAALGGLLIVHAEDADVIGAAPVEGGYAYDAFLRSRPARAETCAIDALIAGSRRTGCRVHVLHLSAADALESIAKAKADGVRITVETCPHYLTLCAESVPEGATEYKCCPPIREKSNQVALWTGLQDGVIDLVVSDHSPSTIELKRLDEGDFATAWGGISSLQLGLSLIWTHGRSRGVSLADVMGWMASAPARLAGLDTKGRIAVGCDADFAVFAPNEMFVVDPARLHHRNAITPYAGQTLRGVVRTTFLRGVPIDLTAAATGRLLARGAL